MSLEVFESQIKTDIAVQINWNKFNALWYAHSKK